VKEKVNVFQSGSDRALVFLVIVSVVLSIRLRLVRARLVENRPEDLQRAVDIQAAATGPAGPLLEQCVLADRVPNRPAVPAFDVSRAFGQVVPLHQQIDQAPVHIVDEVADFDQVRRSVAEVGNRELDLCRGLRAGRRVRQFRIETCQFIEKVPAGLGRERIVAQNRREEMAGIFTDRFDGGRDASERRQDRLRFAADRGR
jgi:hypothetical protein